MEHERASWKPLWCLSRIPVMIIDQASGAATVRSPNHYSRCVLCQVQLHSAKKVLYSAKPLLSAALGKELSAYPFTAKASLPSATCRALGKGFPECHNGTRQRKAAVMARSRWRRLCRVPRVGTRQINVFFIFFKKMLCRVPASGTRQSLFSFFWIFFAKCCR